MANIQKTKIYFVTRLVENNDFEIKSTASIIYSAGLFQLSSYCSPIVPPLYILLFSFTDKAPSEATFRGAEFLSYDLTQTGGEPIVSTQDAISLYFKTRQPNGLLFYTGESTDFCYLYFSISMCLFRLSMY